MKRIAVLVVLFLAVFVSVCQANLLVNGSFETGTYDFGSRDGFMPLLNGSTHIDGWAVGDAGVDWINFFWKASSGSFSLDLNSNNPGSVSQSFATVSGATYTVSFDLAGNPGGGPPDKSLNVLVNGVVTPLQGFTFTNTQSTTNDNMGWVTRSFTFTASSGMTTLEFLSTTHNGTEPNSLYGPALDNVSVAGIPEPSLVYLLAAGLAGLVVTRRRMSA